MRGGGSDSEPSLRPGQLRLRVLPLLPVEIVADAGFESDLRREQWRRRVSERARVHRLRRQHRAGRLRHRQQRLGHPLEPAAPRNVRHHQRWVAIPLLVCRCGVRPAGPATTVSSNSRRRRSRSSHGAECATARERSTHIKGMASRASRATTSRPTSGRSSPPSRVARWQDARSIPAPPSTSPTARTAGRTCIATRSTKEPGACLPSRCSP